MHRRRVRGGGQAGLHRRTPQLIFLRMWSVVTCFNFRLTTVGNSGEESVSPAPSLTERTLRSGSRRLSTRTPKNIRIIQETGKVPLPPSPAIVADAIESHTNAIKDNAMKAVERISIQEKATGLRDRLSNVVSVNAVTLTYEAAFLLYRLIPFVYLVKIPAFQAINTAPHSVLLPDLFVLLTADFWGPFLTWLTTAILVPLGNAYFFNLTATAANVARSKPYDPTISTAPEGYKTDPLTFAVTKALVAYLVHYKGFDFMGLLGGESLKIVEAGVGRETQIIGAGIAGLAAVWESILRR